MTLDELIDAVYLRFAQNWTGTTEVHYAGRQFTEPAPGVSWARVSVVETDAGQSTLGPVGNRKYERDFSIQVQVFTPINGGAKTGPTLAEAARAIFEGVRLDPEAWVNDAVVTREPLAEGDKSYQDQVEAFGVYEITK